MTVVSATCAGNCMMEFVVQEVWAATSVAGLDMSVGIVLRGQAHYVFTTIRWTTRSRLSNVEGRSSECACSDYFEDHRWT